MVELDSIRCLVWYVCLLSMSILVEIVLGLQLLTSSVLNLNVNTHFIMPLIRHVFGDIPNR